MGRNCVEYWSHSFYSCYILLFVLCMSLTLFLKIGSGHSHWRHLHCSFHCAPSETLGFVSHWTNPCCTDLGLLFSNRDFCFDHSTIRVSSVTLTVHAAIHGNEPASFFSWGHLLIYIHIYILVYLHLYYQNQTSPVSSPLHCPGSAVRRLQWSC